MMKPKIIVCDDDHEIVDAIEIYLLQEGYEILKAYDGDEALALLKTQKADLLIIDIMMPRLDGVRATMKLRESSPIPVIILSAKAEDADKVLGLNVGADDYITKPFSPLELVARVRSQLRRFSMMQTMTEQPENLYISGGLTVDDSQKQVCVDGNLIKLTPVEYNIILFLIKHPGQVYTSGQIYEAVWQEDSYGAENTVAVHVRHIREKIEIDPKAPRYLKVVWGLGYKMGDGKA
jgi:DNA-binding response OmpR family regulator